MALCLQFADDLQELIRPEELLLLVLLPESATPHVDPAKVDKGALVSLTLLNEGWLAVISGKLHSSFFLVSDGSVSILVLLLCLSVASTLKLVHEGRV